MTSIRNAPRSVASRRPTTPANGPTQPQGSGAPKGSTSTSGTYTVKDGFEAAPPPSVGAPAAPKGTKLERELGKYLDRNGYQLDGNGNKRPLTAEQKARIIKGLSEYPTAQLEELMATGMDYAVYDPKSPPPALTGKDGPSSLRGLGGAYDDKKKMIYLSSRIFEGKSSFDSTAVIVHETAHAFDDLRRADGAGDRKHALLASGASPLVDRAFEAYNARIDARMEELYKKHPGLREQIKETRRVPYWVQQELAKVGFDESGYSASNKAEFFAVGVEHYFGTAQQRAALKEKAPGLFRYIQDFMSAS